MLKHFYFYLGPSHDPTTLCQHEMETAVRRDHLGRDSDDHILRHNCILYIRWIFYFSILHVSFNVYVKKTRYTWRTIWKC